jgi:hypothetical protein
MARHEMNYRCGAYDAFAQLDAYHFWPQMSMLPEIDAAFPDSRFVLPTRNFSAWLASVDHWPGMHERLEEDDIPGLPAGRGGRASELLAWTQGHFAAVRAFFGGLDGAYAAHPAAGDKAVAQTDKGIDLGKKRPRGPRGLLFEYSLEDAARNKTILEALGRFVLSAGDRLEARIDIDVAAARALEREKNVSQCIGRMAHRYNRNRGRRMDSWVKAHEVIDV